MEKYQQTQIIEKTELLSDCSDTSDEMESSSQDNLVNMLKAKRICRFCMTQKEPLTNIYSKENRVNSSAPLPLQVMACVSIEVFSNDGMPSTICERCRLLMEFCYKFKHMCKKADNTLRQFPLTGKWPDQLEIPKLPIVSETGPRKQTILNSIPVVKIEETSTNSKVVTFKKEPTAPARITSTPRTTPSKPKILNKSSVKILNKEANMISEPMLSNPIITRNESGQVEIVTEILDTATRIEEPDPVLSAEPVETNVFPCPHCDRSFPLRQLLDIHMVNHNRERSFACDVCDRRFFSKYDLGKHMLIHTGEKPYECVVCKKAFTRSTLLHRHEKIHTDQPKFLCVYCEKPFLSKTELEKHTSRHKKNRPFPCKICGKSFAFKQGLERHETIHAKDQPFPCQYCEMSFSTPSKLSRHLTAHAGERPFPCKLCPKAYLLSHHLTRHLRSHSQGSGTYKCYDCERSFGNRDDLIYHSAVHATRSLMCPLCKEQFKSIEQVTEHIKQHAEGEQYACEFCDLIFLTEERLQAHAEVEHVADVAAYEELDKINEKRNENYTAAENESSHEEEVIQEFIIEEYHDTDEQLRSEKEIKEVHNEERVKEKSPTVTKVVTTQRLLNKKPIAGRGLKATTAPARVAAIKVEETETEHMEIETLDAKDDDESYHSEKEWTDDDDNYEPPSKSMKVTKRMQTRGKATAAPDKPAASTSQQPNKVSVFKVPAKEVKMIQTSIKSVLQHLPKSVTVIKKEKTSTAAEVTTEKAHNTSVSEVRILNEKIIRKADPPKASPPKQAKISENKTPVRVIERKPVAVSSNEGTPTTRSKSSPVAGPSKTPVTSPSSASDGGSKPSPKQSPPVLTKVPHPGARKLVEMTIDNRKVKVQKIVMSKAEVAAMAKEGKIEIKGGTMILKQNGKSLTGRIAQRPSTTGGSSTK